ncbi:hypothetical protein GF324_01275, partial [bacterium]|nr:hypothetical protein [bacterium]
MKVQAVVKLVLLVAAALLISRPASAQENIDLILVNESIESAIRNTNIIADDPSLTGAQYGMKTQDDSDEDEEGEGDGQAVGLAAMPLYVGAEVAVNPSTRSLTLPVSTRFRKTDLSLKLPFIFSRTMDYASKTASASGVGDISFTVGRWFKVSDYMLYPEFMLKLPTGDAEADDGGYLVPLGSGSTDFSLGLGSMFEVYKGRVFARMQYRNNGSDTRVAEYDVNGTTFQSEYDTKNGNLLLINGEYSQPINTRFAGFGGLSLLFGGDGTTD